MYGVNREFALLSLCKTNFLWPMVFFGKANARDAETPKHPLLSLPLALVLKPDTIMMTFIF